ncbi:SUMF1/EgtB/PvdO family nonheme iron enzyme, partial [Jatrophihabitans sp.]|uniref:SUMF1/EgtB/PvdO family nonheme iron enzyme n=1 Tax=Jatrophihabitans sp. TaxID=1932789 RepID=UPI0030C759AE|nr:egtB [Jatrophihabitans sp.]
MHETAVRGLESARARTLALTDFDEAELTAQHSPLMSPLVWDLAHIGQQEDLWLLRDGEAARPGVLPPEVDRLYDAFQFGRAERVDLPLLDAPRARRFLADVRDRSVERLAAAEGDFTVRMVEQHEQQHVETMLATHQLRRGVPLLGVGDPLPSGRAIGDSVLVPAGEFVLGVDAADEPTSLDNERPAHVIDLPAFRIGRVPVSNAQWLEFIADGGYDEPRWWSARGWQHRVEAGLVAPLFWTVEGAGATRRRFGIVEEVPPAEAVQHVCFFEAEAFAAWSGARLPTEQEWEKACAWDPAAGRRRTWPWGSAAPTAELANL